MKIALLSTLVLTAAAAVCTAAETSTVLARAGDAEVKIDDIRTAIETLNPRDQVAISRDPALLNQTVRTLLVQRILLQEALAKKWDKQPDVTALIERARDAVITESYLQSLSKPEEEFPGEAELKAAYDANKAALVVPRQAKIAQIYLAAPKTADAAALDKEKSRLETLRKALRQANADFAAIARAQSDDKESAKADGEIGWLSDSQMQPEIRAKVAELVKNGVSEPIRLADGWHIIKCLEVRDARTASFEEARGRLTEQLRADRARSKRQAYLAKLLQEKPVSVNELALPKVLDKPEK
ncbi:MAG: peptidylprolyl isomerase [Chthoniobacteraceae bacterium]|nr:peptidylprolyl isomerase [Chthoniobacteraceae bacterium]